MSEKPLRPVCRHMTCWSAWRMEPEGVGIRVVCAGCGMEVSKELGARIEYFTSKRGRNMVRCVCSNGQIFQAHVARMEPA